MFGRPYPLLPECGCWYLNDKDPWNPKQYIPQVDLKAHSTILSVSSRTTLTQTFINPTSGDLKDVKYTFPLHDGVSVVGFKCEVEDRVIHGLVKEREEAKTEYQDAVKKGQTAALLEQSGLASDTFTTSVGKIPVGSKAVVEITYLGELQHDAQADGVRFSIPSVICPRYPNSSVNLRELSESLTTSVERGAINITVDVAVDKGSSIRGLQSPSHPIAISLGRTSVTAQDVFETNLASATLTMQQGNAFFDKDFVLIVNAKDQEVPSGFVETHPTIPNQRAVMATLVPKFNIPNNSPEIVFIIDRSGSMEDEIATLRSALRVFLKSLPVGVKFNICSFGSSYSFMWTKSQAYDASSLEKALQYVDSVEADFGGTEMFQPVQATVDNRLKDLDLEVLLLSDGDIWDQNTLFKYINKTASEQPIRFFSLGIGDGASQSLIQGIARAGDGFAQFVNDNEQLDKKVVRMLKGALTPHIKDYTAEVVYEKDGEDDFEIIEKSNEIPTGENFPPPHKCSEEAMEIDSENKDPKEKEPISLFDISFKESDIKTDGAPLEANLPKLQPPKVLQAPYKIPPLYPFNRTTVYFLLSPEATSARPKSLVIRGTSKHGPLLLKIPIEDIGQGTSLHQLAARKITLELEEGRGWIFHAKDAKGRVVTDEHESKKEDTVKREAVRLGVQFQVAGKYCSFVAVESNKDGERTEQKERAVSIPDEHGEKEIYSVPRGGVARFCAARSSQPPVMYQQMRQTAPSARRYALPVTCTATGGSVYSQPESAAYVTPHARGEAFSATRSSTRGGSTRGNVFAAAAQPGEPSFPSGDVRMSETSGTAFDCCTASADTSSADDASTTFGGFCPSSNTNPSFGTFSAFGASSSASSKGKFGSPPSPQVQLSPFGAPRPPATTSSLFGKCPPSTSAFSISGSLFGASSSSVNPSPNAGSLFGAPASDPNHSNTERGFGSGLFGRSSISTPKPSNTSTFGALPADLVSHSDSPIPTTRFGEERKSAQAPQSAVHELISLQSFDGSWQWNEDVFATMELDASSVEKTLDWSSILGKQAGVDAKDTKQRSIVATLLVMAYLHKRRADEKETWELVGDKAMNWAVQAIGEIGGRTDRSSDELLGLFDGVF
ncbi:hypothetical protein AJ79_00422 [Helicocarpus griseus UAMH5409]|uniref:von Willebrand domain-containing protein n=1 Tax=Helicocarpus griseus UAMH5409 TaxID=1447875 RepID=A0A2B7YA10_9EURO|nr:hypothetical protein AJ79_00422 [Helicocarpus griseus UAMH5409]